MSTLRVNNMTNVGGTGPTYAPGHIIQVVSASYSTQVASSSSTYSDTGLTATITPKSANSKILVIAVHSDTQKTAANSENRAAIQLLRDSTSIATTGTLLAYTGSANYNNVGTSMVVLDSPATTSAIVYKTQFKSVNNVAAVQVQSDGSTSTLTLMEVAA